LKDHEKPHNARQVPKDASISNRPLSTLFPNQQNQDDPKISHGTITYIPENSTYPRIFVITDKSIIDNHTLFPNIVSSTQTRQPRLVSFRGPPTRPTTFVRSVRLELDLEFRLELLLPSPPRPSHDLDLDPDPNVDRGLLAASPSSMARSGLGPLCDGVGVGVDALLAFEVMLVQNGSVVLGFSPARSRRRGNDDERTAVLLGRAAVGLEGTAVVTGGIGVGDRGGDEPSTDVGLGSSAGPGAGPIDIGLGERREGEDE
jgi:hypothetical protein